VKNSDVARCSMSWYVACPAIDAVITTPKCPISVIIWSSE
jgi:hypothetical protein